MTPEQFMLRIEMIQAELDALKAASTIPYEVDQAFRTRLKGLLDLAVSGKSASSENQSVNEAGSGTYSVLTAPDQFLQITIGGATKYIPAFTS